MAIDELEASALKLDAQSRARLAGKLLDSLESLSPEEVDAVWAEEARRRDSELEVDPSQARPVADVFRDARARLG